VTASFGLAAAAHVLRKLAFQPVQSAQSE